MALVTPRPIAWVSTLELEGSLKVARFSFFDVLGVGPPVVGSYAADRADGKPTLTLQNIACTRDLS